MTEQELIEENKRLDDENTKLTEALVRINEIVEKNKGQLLRSVYDDLKLLCDEEQRQDGL